MVELGGDAADKDENTSLVAEKIVRMKYNITRDTIDSL